MLYLRGQKGLEKPSDYLQPLDLYRKEDQKMGD